MQVKQQTSPRVKNTYDFGHFVVPSRTGVNNVDTDACHVLRLCGGNEPRMEERHDERQGCASERLEWTAMVCPALRVDGGACSHGVQRRSENRPQ